MDRQTMGEYDKASLYEWLQIDLAPLLPKQILHSAPTPVNSKARAILCGSPALAATVLVTNL
ncbi:MAG: hypothetical protein ACRERD_28335 [Candidatus Binatia bacterium]